MCKEKRKWARLGICSLFLGALVLGGLFLGTHPASAVDSGPTVTGDVCMQQIFGGSKVTNANRLNCTASDIKIAKAISAINLDTGEASCVAGVPFTLQATFQVNVTANERYDAAFFFNITGGADARNPEGTCSQSVLTNGVAPALNLDKDTCGDLNAGTYQNITFTIPGVACEDTDNDQLLNLPNCTSWHSNAGTVCSVSGSGIAGAGPETKSKCNCDDTFQVPIQVESPSGAVVKEATKAVVTYSVKVKNNSSSRTVKINSIVDDVYGDLATRTGSTCNTLIGTTLAPNTTSAACTFTVQYDKPGTFGATGADANGDLKDTVTAELEDTVNQNKVNVEGTVTINVDLNVAP